MIMSDYFKEYELGNTSSDWENLKKLVKEIQTCDLQHTISFIQKVVCKYFNVPYDIIYKRTNKRSVVQYRQIVHFFAIKLSGLSLAKIGEMTGGFDHATCMNSRKTVQNWIDTDRHFKQQIEEISKILKYVA
jgi:chromosomal replication initiator protein